MLQSSLGYYINPLVNVVFGVLLLRERLRPAQILAVLLAGVGVVYLTVSYGEFPWIALALAASFGLLQYIAPTGIFLLAVFYFDEPFSMAQIRTFIMIWTALVIYSADSVIYFRRV